MISFTIWTLNEANSRTWIRYDTSTIMQPDIEGWMDRGRGMATWFHTWCRRNLPVFSLNSTILKPCLKPRLEPSFNPEPLYLKSFALKLKSLKILKQILNLDNLNEQNFATLDRRSRLIEDVGADDDILAGNEPVAGHTNFPTDPAAVKDAGQAAEDAFHLSLQLLFFKMFLLSFKHQLW